MAVVGEAHILVRAITTGLKKDIEKGFQLKGTDFGMIALTMLSFAITCIALMAGNGVVSANQEAVVDGGNTLAVAKVLFVNYLWPFELSSLLILMAIVASIVIAKKDKASH